MKKRLDIYTQCVYYITIENTTPNGKMEDDKMKQYTLRPKNGKGANWYMNADQLFTGNYVKAYSKDGFETIVDIRNYDVIR